MKKNRTVLVLLGVLLNILFFTSCESVSGDVSPEWEEEPLEKLETKRFTIADVQIEKALQYDKYTLDDIYPYKDTTRRFQWPKIRKLLFFADSIQIEPASWAILQNYKNKNGEAALIKAYHRNEYGNIADEYGVQRYQSISVYSLDDTIQPVRYGRDGSLIRFKEEVGTFIKGEYMWSGGEWLIPRKYVKQISDSVVFNKIVVVDVTNQNITTLEKIDEKWHVLSKNPATTGLHRPPHQQETPVGLFVFQEKKPKMFYVVDGTSKIGGYSPFASRFSNGGYIHGVPVNLPRTTNIEWSASLGTTPRSHMCVRNATSHAEFLYNWIEVEGSLLFVID